MSAVLLSVAASAALLIAPPARADTCTLPDPNAPYRLVFADEFDGGRLDRGRWNTEFLWGPGVVINGELQYYVNRGQFGYDPFRVSDGVLSITAIKTPFDRSRLYLTRGIYSPTTIELRWRQPAGARRYEVYRGGTLIGSPTNSAFLLRNLRDGIDYTYEVAAIGAGGERLLTETITVNTADRARPSPERPFSLGVDAVIYSATAGAIRWDPPNRAGRYEVYRDGRLYRSLEGAGTSSLYEPALVPGEVHDYRVVAYDRCDEVIASGDVRVNTADGPTPPEPLVPRLVVRASVYSENTGGLSWNRVAGAVRYVVRENGEVLRDGDGRSLFVTGLVPGVERRFRVTALAADGRLVDETSRVVNTGDDGLALSQQRFLSGVITSYDSFRFRYGRVEMRARMPAGNGYWSAFWLLNAYYKQDQPEDPEIDIVEALGERRDRIYQVYHWRTDPDGDGIFEGARDSESHVPVPDFAAGFHTYRVDWEPGRLVWYVDGVETKRIEGPEVSDEQMYIIANLAVGGRFPVPPDDSTPFPGRFDIDWIRVYQR